LATREGIAKVEVKPVSGAADGGEREEL